jgi:hypothetical protein
MLAALLFSTAASAQDTEAALKAFKAKLAALGAPRLEGRELYFGKTKISENTEIVDGMKKSHKCAATVFARDGEEFARASTNILKPDGTRAQGTNLAHNKAYEAVSKGEKYCGEADILGKKYDTCYEPIKVGKDVVGIYLVGFEKK